MCRCVGSGSGGCPRRKPSRSCAAIGVRHRAGERPAGTQHAPDLGDDVGGLADMLEQLAGDYGVEGGIVEGQWPLDVAPHRLDAALLRNPESLAVDVHSHDAVAREEILRDSACAAAEIEHLSSRTTNRSDEQRQALRYEDELTAVAPQPMVSGIGSRETVDAEAKGVFKGRDVPSASPHSCIAARSNTASPSDSLEARLLPLAPISSHSGSATAAELRG